jgi:hypothetical protein
MLLCLRFLELRLLGETVAEKVKCVAFTCLNNIGHTKPRERLSLSRLTPQRSIQYDTIHQSKTQKPEIF